MVECQKGTEANMNEGPPSGPSWNNLSSKLNNDSFGL